MKQEMKQKMKLNEVKVIGNWIEGEYKWMPKNIKAMPAGWKKVISEVDTLPTTLGFGDFTEPKSRDIEWTSSDENKKKFNIASGYLDPYYLIAANGPNVWFNVINLVKIEILWQYDPNNIYSKTNIIEFKIPDVQKLMKK